MSMWTLILILATDTGDWRGGVSVSTTAIPYFQTKESCQAAGAKLVKERANGPIKRLTADWSCVSAE